MARPSKPLRCLDSRLWFWLRKYLCGAVERSLPQRDTRARVGGILCSDGATHSYRWPPRVWNQGRSRAFVVQDRVRRDRCEDGRAAARSLISVSRARADRNANAQVELHDRSRSEVPTLGPLSYSLPVTPQGQQRSSMWDGERRAPTSVCIPSRGSIQGAHRFWIALGCPVDPVGVRRLTVPGFGVLTSRTRVDCGGDSFLGLEWLGA